MQVRRHAPFQSLSEGSAAVGGLMLAIAYLFAYLHDPAMPGADWRSPLGWNGWFDQGNYTKSATALADGELAVDRHWYPLGYSLAGALAARWMPAHCFLIPDLLCLLACFLGFLKFSRAVGVERPVAVLLFLLGTLGSASVRRVWAQPWNTTLSAALIWWLLALSARGGRDEAPARELARMAGAGALCGCIVATRPADALLVAVWLGAIVIGRTWSGRTLLLPVAAVFAGIASVALPYLTLYLSIYGLHPTRYMRLSAGIGFRLTGLWWKSYLLLVDPRPWYPNGAGLLERLPWLAPGFAGLVALPFLRSERRATLALMSLLIISTWVLSILYGDLQPGGLWLFENVHYFKWTFPGLLLLGFVLCRNLTGPHRPVVLASCLLVLLATAVHPVAKRSGPDGHAWVLQIPQPVPPLLPTYFGSLIVHAGPAVLVNTRDFRAEPDDQGLRLVGFYRAFSGPLALVSHVDGIASRSELPAIRWRASFGLGWPCWLPPYACDRRGPR